MGVTIDFYACARHGARNGKRARKARFIPMLPGQKQPYPQRYREYLRCLSSGCAGIKSQKIVRTRPEPAAAPTGFAYTRKMTVVVDPCRSCRRLRSFDLLLRRIDSIQRPIHRQLAEHDDLSNTQQCIATRSLRPVRQIHRHDIGRSQ